MTNKERILKTLAFEPTDRTPFAVLNGQMWICARNGHTAASMLDLPDAGAQMLVDAYNEIGTDIMVTGRLEIYEEDGSKYLHLMDAELIWDQEEQP